MPYFQNPFDQEFRGNWIIGDRQYTLNFNIAGNVNSAITMLAWQVGPYDLSSDNTLTINYAVDPTLKQFQSRAVNVAGATASSTTAYEIAAKLNADAIFAEYWTASVKPIDRDATKLTVFLQSKKERTRIKAYISNTSAEKKLRFNKNAPIAELPTYFDRHSVANALTFADGLASLVKLDTGTSFDLTMIQEQGYSGTEKEDYELLYGRAGLFSFKKQTLDGSDRITSIIEYPAGAKVGDLAKKTEYQYTGAATTASIITEVPYTLTSGDLVTPP